MSTLRRLNIVALGAWLALAGDPAFAQKTSPKKANPPPTQGTAKASVEKVLDFFHVDAVLDESFKFFEEAMKRRRKEITIEDSRAAQILSLAGRIYKKKNLYNVFKIAYSKNTTMENMTAIYNWMLTPQGVKLRQAYNAHHNGNWTSWEKLVPKEPKQNRRNAVTTYGTATREAERYAAMQIGADYGVYLALNAYAPKASQESTKVLKDKMKQRKPGYLKTGADRGFIYDYALLKDFKNEEVDELSKNSSSAAGSSFWTSYQTALEQTLEAAASTLAGEITKGTK